MMPCRSGNGIFSQATVMVVGVTPVLRNPDGGEVGTKRKKTRKCSLILLLLITPVHNAERGSLSISLLLNLSSTTRNELPVKST